MPQIPAYIRTTSMVFCITIMVLGVIGNIMVPIVIMKTKDMRNSTNIFLTNLSIADLLVLLVCTPTVLVEVNTRPETWVLGQEMCKAVPFVELTVAHASVLTILAISFERYYAICEPLKAGYVCTKTRALLICLIAWAVAALFTSPILLVAEYKFVRYFDGSQVPVCLTQASGPWTMGFFLMTISLFFVIPFIILVVLYGIIARDLISKDGAMMKIRPTKYELSFKARKQVVLMLGAVVLAFFLCLLPFRIFTLWVILSPAEFEVDMERYYNMLCFCRIMLYLNSAINPVLYNLMSSKFRKGFLKLCILCDPLKRSLKVRPRTATINTTTTSSSILSRSSNRRTSERTTCSTEKIEPKLISVPDCEMGLLRQQTNCTDDFASLPLGNGNKNRSPHSSMESVNIEGVEVDQSVKVPNYRVKCQRHISFDDTLVINKPKPRERVMFQQSLDERKIMKSAKNGVPESNGGY